jgi:hypothetical protein
MTRFRTITLALGTVIGLVLPIAVGTAPASAQKIGSDTFHDEGTFLDSDFCGTGMDVEGHFTADGRALLRLQGRDAIFYYMDHVRSVIEWTNLETGQQATEVYRQTTSKDLRITVNDDGTITIVALFTGPGQIYGDAGRLIAKADGQIRLQTVLDYNSTLSDPTDDTFISEEQIFGSTGTNDDLCAAILEDWGLTG